MTELYKTPGCCVDCSSAHPGCWCDACVCKACDDYRICKECMRGTGYCNKSAKMCLRCRLLADGEDRAHPKMKDNEIDEKYEALVQLRGNLFGRIRENNPKAARIYFRYMKMLEGINIYFNLTDEEAEIIRKMEAST